MSISVIIPSSNDTEMMSTTLSCLVEQPNDFELIVVDGTTAGKGLNLVDGRAKVVSRPGVIRGSLLNAGAEVAKGEILLFLWPGSCLPPAALPAIEDNLELLPQTIGGSFHVKFNENTLFTRGLTKFLKWQRYQGRYYGSGGIFIRKQMFLALGGFRPYDLLEDYDLTRRMEDYGPTLYLPETVIVSTRKFQGKKLKAVLIWLIIQSLFMLGVHPNRLARWYRL
jgi:hypothetical protein